MELKFILEAILFSAQNPLSLKELRDVFSGAVEHAPEDESARDLKKVKEDVLTAALEDLARDHQTAARSFRLVCVANAWQFVTEPDYAPWLKALVGHKARPPRLSQPALETLTIIAYRQPITRAEIEQVRGVAVDGVMQTLVERGLVEQAGRAEVVGRPMTYATTPAFLEYFGLRNLEELPAGDELRRIVVQKPQALATVDPDPAQQLALPGEEQKAVDTKAEAPEAGAAAAPVSENAASAEIQEPAPATEPPPAPSAETPEAS